MSHHRQWWSWSFTSIRYPHHFGDNLPIDIVRLLVAFGGVILMFAIARVVIESARRELSMPMGQLARFVGLAFIDVYVSLTEVFVLGSPATPRLVLGVLGIGVSIYGVRLIRREQARTPITHHKPFRRPKR